MKVPEGEYVAGLPTGFVKIWQILWAVDPARLKQLDPGIRQSVGKIAINYQIKVSETMADLHTSEARSLHELATQLKLV